MYKPEPKQIPIHLESLVPSLFPLTAFTHLGMELSIFNDNIEIGGSSSDIYISTTSSELLIKKIANKFLIGYQFYTTEINELIVPVNA